VLTIKHLAVPYYTTTTSSFPLKKTTCPSTWPLKPFKTLTFRWPWLSDDLVFQLTVFQLTLIFRWPWLSIDLDFQMTLTHWIAHKQFRTPSLGSLFSNFGVFCFHVPYLWILFLQWYVCSFTDWQGRGKAEDIHYWTICSPQTGKN